MKWKLSRLGLFVLTVFMLEGHAFAGPGDRQDPDDTLDRMMREGWTPVAPGVLQIHKGGNRVETFAIGPEGMRWALRQMTARLRFLEREYRTYPSSDLQRTITALRHEVAELRDEVENAGAEDEPLAVEKSCSVSHSVLADATYLTSAAGVKATASATFNNTCGYYAETYAYAYARATQGTLVETLIQEDPKSGYNVTSNATATVYGSADCLSEAYSYARYSPENIFYSASDSNSICPAALAASIGGLPYLHVYGYNYDTVTRSASPTGGVPPYTYKWYRNGNLVGTGSSYTETFYGNNSDWNQTVPISLTVTDSNGQTANATSSSYVYYHRQN
jgi:hypothetical protein